MSPVTSTLSATHAAISLLAIPPVWCNPLLLAPPRCATSLLAPPPGASDGAGHIACLARPCHVATGSYPYLYPLHLLALSYTDAASVAGSSAAPVVAASDAAAPVAQADPTSPAAAPVPPADSRRRAPPPDNSASSSLGESQSGSGRDSTSTSDSSDFGAPAPQRPKRRRREDTPAYCRAVAPAVDFFTAEACAHPLPAAAAAAPPLAPHG